MWLMLFYGVCEFEWVWIMCAMLCGNVIYIRSALSIICFTCSNILLYTNVITYFRCVFGMCVIFLDFTSLDAWKFWKVSWVVKPSSNRLKYYKIIWCLNFRRMNCLWILLCYELNQLGGGQLFTSAANTAAW